MERPISSWRRSLRVTLVLVAVLVLGCGDDPDLDTRGEGDAADQIHLVFGTEGDPETEIDLSEESPRQIRLLNAPTSITLEGHTVRLSHDEPVHEVAILGLAGSELTVSVWNVTQPADGPAYPLSVSDDQRWVRDRNGHSFHANGAAPWSLFAQLDGADASLYLADRAEKGVNLIIGRLIEHMFSDNTPVTSNRYGEVPFVRRLNGRRASTEPGLASVIWSLITGTSTAEDFTTPNEDYWQHVDWSIREAYRHGITVLAFPAYIGYNNGPQGWTAEMIENGERRMSEYGRFIGQRYRAYPNLIWGLGGDAPLEAEASEHNAMAAALAASDPDHLFTAKSRRNRSSLDDYDEPWLDINATYAEEHNTAEEISRSWNQFRVMPTFLIEGRYGNEHGMTDRDIRRQMWQAVTSGGFGHAYGNAPTWYFGTDAQASANRFADLGGLNWKAELDRFGSRYLPHVATVLTTRDLSRMTPDHAHPFIESEQAWATASDSALLAYTETNGQAVLIDQARFAPGIFTVTWFDPRTGSGIPGGTETFGGSGSAQFLPPDQEDWVLVIEHHALGLPPLH